MAGKPGSGRKPEDLTGQKFGKLKALHMTGEHHVSSSGKIGQPIWLFQCECGNLKALVPGDVKRTQGGTTSCGCVRKPHGYSQLPIYRVHKDMEARCYDCRELNFHNYGGRGIYLAEEWLGKEGRIRFCEWALDNGWKQGLEIDRIDNNGPYAPWNCRFVTRQKNCWNKRNNFRVEFAGDKYVVDELMQILNSTVTRNTVIERMNRGWEVEHAFTAPARSTKEGV